MTHTSLRVKNRISWAATSLYLLAPLIALLVAPMCAARADAPARAKGTLTDAQIIGIVHTANDGEIKQGKEAEKVSTNPEVKDFAQMMIQQHNQVNDDLSKIAKAEHLHSKGSSDASALKKGADQTLSNLKSLKGADFDHAYVDAQVKAHQEVLDTIDNTLLPDAKDPKLQAMLQKTRVAVETHLQHARKLQADLAMPATG